MRGNFESYRKAVVLDSAKGGGGGADRTHILGYE